MCTRASLWVSRKPQSGWQKSRVTAQEPPERAATGNPPLALLIDLTATSEPEPGEIISKAHICLPWLNEWAKLLKLNNYWYAIKSMNHVIQTIWCKLGSGCIVGVRCSPMNLTDTNSKSQNIYNPPAGVRWLAWYFHWIARMCCMMMMLWMCAWQRENAQPARAASMVLAYSFSHFPTTSRNI